jgi:hypothetical protein
MHRSAGIPLLVLLTALATACGGRVVVGERAGECRYDYRGECIGVPLGPLCEDSVCTDGVDCSQVVTVASDGELDAAIRSASAGTCITLEPGDYVSTARLPAGVSLLGQTADTVRVQGVEMVDGGGAVLRGVSTGRLLIEGGTSAVVFGVRVEGSSDDAIRVQGNASVSLQRSEVLSGAGIGVRGIDHAWLSMERSVVLDTEGPGIWGQCGTGCDCPGVSTISLHHVRVERAGGFGVALLGIIGTIDGIELLDTRTGADFAAGGGLSISDCSEVVADAVRVAKSSFFGVLVDHSSAQLGASLAGGDAGEGLDVSGTSTGMVISGVQTGQRVSVHGAKLHDNAGLGFCVGGFSTDVSIFDSSVSNTSEITLPSGTGTAAKVGDGLQWTTGTRLVVDGLSLSGSQRQSVLINGAVLPGSRIDNLSLTGGDESTGILQQQVSSPSDAPEIGPGVPPVQQASAATLDVACP